MNFRVGSGFWSPDLKIVLVGRLVTGPSSHKACGGLAGGAGFLVYPNHRPGLQEASLYEG